MLVVQVQVVRMVGCRSGGAKLLQAAAPSCGVWQAPATRAAGVACRATWAGLRQVLSCACGCVAGTLPSRARVMQAAACAV
jgi:hypothetical protein